VGRERASGSENCPRNGRANLYRTVAYPRRYRAAARASGQVDGARWAAPLRNSRRSMARDSRALEEVEYSTAACSAAQHNTGGPQRLINMAFSICICNHGLAVYRTSPIRSSCAAGMCFRQIAPHTPGNGCARAGLMIWRQRAGPRMGARGRRRARDPDARSNAARARPPSAPAEWIVEQDSA
jgi:hypothetical protein